MLAFIFAEVHTFDLILKSVTKPLITIYHSDI